MKIVALLVTSALMVDVAPARSVMGALIDVYAEHPEPRTVAVVGNMPMQPNAERAKAIDASDLVIRVNGFVTDEPGAPPTVGRRTHVVVFNRALRATKYVFEDYRRRLYLMVEPGRLHWEPDNLPGWWPEDLGLVPVNNAEVTLPLSDALGLPTRKEGTWATTGTMAAWIARTCYPEAELLLTGYSFIDDPNQTHWMHAAGDSCIVGPEHQIAAEGRLLDSWTKTGRTRLLR
jgi:glycosyl transferase family 29 (putative sialyltransferase)